jgi:large subunit ribosomal protein L4
MATQRKTSKAQPAARISRIVSSHDLHLSPDHKREMNAETFAGAVRSLMQNWRQGTASSKTRGEVAFSNKKPWKQKGTGRARAGSRRSPLWRKGGVIFGPQPRVRTLRVPREAKKGIFNALLWQNLEREAVVALDWAASQGQPKTAQAYSALKEAGLQGKRVILFLSHNDYETYASFNNIPNVRMLLFDQPNAYALADGDYWVFLEKDAEAFKNMVNAWL